MGDQNMTPEPTVDIDAAFELGTPIDEAMNEAVAEAVRKHQQAGMPLVVWRNGRVEHIPAEMIKVQTPAVVDRKTA
jgi:DhnA family fructose-bisphosphate aldolase class Ia